MDVTVYYQDEQSEDGTLTPEEDLKSRVITSDDTDDTTIVASEKDTVEEDE